MNDVGGISVVCLVTGGHFIPDIQTMVPHRAQVFIPIEKYLKSKDLHRAINSGQIFKLDSVIGYQQETVPAVDTERLTQLELENGRLKEALELANKQTTALKTDLELSNKQNSDLKSDMGDLKSQMTTILAALGRIEAAPPQIVMHSTSTPLTASVPISDVVGGEAPMFLPDLSQDLGEARINVEQSESSGSVSGASGKLRELRKKSKS